MLKMGVRFPSLAPFIPENNVLGDIVFFHSPAHRWEIGFRFGKRVGKIVKKPLLPPGYKVKYSKR